MRSRLLFVDDEPQVLQGLRRMLRRHRDEWEMVFVGGGQEALDALAASPFDVLVTDMKMPGVGGVELLRAAAENYPSVARVVLSGQTDEEDLMLSSISAHQYLAKPCAVEALESVIERASAIRDFVTDEALLALVTSLTTLPSFPAISASIAQEVHGDDPSMQRVGDIVSRDIALAAKLLQLVNSSFFGLAREISDVREAVNLLGSNRVLALCTGMNLFSQVTHETGGVSFDGLWQRSVTVASWAQAFAKTCGLDKEAVTAAYLGGLLSVTGNLILASNLPSRYMRATINDAQLSTDTSELAEFGATFPQVGAYVLGLWGLPSAAVEAVGFHRAPSDFDSGGEPSALTAVHVAAALIHAVLSDTEATYDLDHLAATGVDAHLDDWAQACLEGAPA